MISANNEHNRRANEDEGKRGRKEAKQISFRVSEDEYLKLQRSAETLNMSVPAFVKKKAQGAKLVTPKFGVESQIEMHKELMAIGRNVNQIAHWCNRRQDEAVEEEQLKDLERNIKKVQEELNSLWQSLS